jgi:muramoyltetrapeptide carboxypeptidase
LNLFKSWGLKPVVMPHVYERDQYLAGPDEHRISDLLSAWSDDSISGVICARGGYGSYRIVDRFDYQLASTTPKVFVGYSDITAFHLAFIQRSNLVTFYGPVAALAPARQSATATHNFMRSVLMGRQQPGALSNLLGEANTISIHGGRAVGPLLGGNLSILCASIGTSDEPREQGMVLLLEDVGEPLYSVDRLLTQLLRTGFLDQVAAVAVGEFVKDEARAAPLPRDQIATLLSDRLSSLGVPVVYGFPIGHTQEQWTLPLGVQGEIDGNTGHLSLLDIGTSSEG